MKRMTTVLALSTAAILGLSACGGGGDPLSTDSPSPTGSGAATGAEVVIGSADFPESELLAEIYAGALKAKGINATTKPRIGSREIYLKALEDGSIQAIPEYTGALGFFYDKNFKETDPEKVYTAVQGLIPAEFALLEKSAAEDNDSIVVTKATADEHQLKAIGDLKAHAGDLSLGAPPEFEKRPQGIPGLTATYGVTFGSFRPLTGQALVQALKNGQVDAANIFTTDPSIAENGFVSLEDPQKLFGSQNIVPLVAKDNAEQFAPALDPVSKALTTEIVSGLLKQTVVDKKDAKDVAAQFLKDNNLG
ncbi:glycine/betaine ABC transporter substrate-binding protein [Knoellia sinensis KCTC 19936]|uniref:Glycine/betaine ABC transporter substrate-binding protein n=1 Tax=Knoellia sinensis KCTC 19936 TaxID=1385520 RepID=A0A0A0J6F1_9MICO|nr:ABC transporter substrate-binding protein [Knoellia sinensis]KGN31632.1 glycine/betaine ABC transporter substrate-binding protein [Knoellia sinensis KCTC 19936]